jgi:hypothetical protein
MKDKKYLPLYYKWMETGSMNHLYDWTHDGLCAAIMVEFGMDEMRRMKGLFIPDSVADEGFYWGSGFCYNDMRGIFTPLRQTIVLFLAAMNNEL